MRYTEAWHTGWRFHLGEAVGADFKGYDDSAWLPVTVPHDWAVSLPFDKTCSSGSGYLPGGVGWYRRAFTLGDVGDGRVYLTFDGVYKRPKVWVNSHYAGERAYGYSTFTLDITPFVHAGENLVAVRCEHNDLADSRWFTGNGIDRDVRLTVVGSNHFAPGGLFARTLSADENEARIQISAEIVGEGKLCAALYDANGDCVAEGAETLTVAHPRLWSPEEPNLYRLVCRLTRNGEAVDEVALPFGIRVIRFDAEQGFFLNGRNMKMKGVCVHHDAGVLGAAVPRAVWAARLATLKEAGCNALRFAHNPPDPHLLDLCDELGFLVMDEAFDEWEGCKNKWWQGHNVYPPKHYGYSEDWGLWHERDLMDFVRRDRNHACVVMWSIGNEVDYPNDPYVHPSFASMTGNNDANKPAAERIYNPDKPNAERLVTLAKELAAIVRREDDSRPVTAALAFPELSAVIGMADPLDVVGYNYKEHLYAEHHDRWPNRVLLGSENSHAPKAWLAVRDNPRIASQFLWTGIDFLGECHGWPYRISQAGMVDLCGHKKPRWYQRKAMWTNEPVVKLAVSNPDRPWDTVDAWMGQEGEMKRVTCLTNADTAELFVNGVSQGAQTVGDAFEARWDVPYAPGEIRVEAHRAGETLTDALGTPGSAARLEASTLEITLPADGHSAALVDLALLDESGRVAASDDRPVRCQIVGSMDFLGLENGCPFDLTCYALTTRSTWHGRAVVYLRAGEEKGDAALVLAANGLPTVKVTVHLT